jgi:outer membrane protein assembly factor BamB
LHEEVQSKQRRINRGVVSQLVPETAMSQYRALGFAWVVICLWLAQPKSFVLGADESSLEHFPNLSSHRDWPWWRGPSRNGIATAIDPIDFRDADAYLWKAPIPGRGHSSPIVVGDQVFLTAADEPQEIQSVLAFNRTNGELVWKEKVSQGGFPSKNHPKNTEATPTIACDGERLFASFFHHLAIHVTALDLQGKILWSQSVGAFNPKKYE